MFCCNNEEELCLSDVLEWGRMEAEMIVGDTTVTY